MSCEKGFCRVEIADLISDGEAFKVYRETEKRFKELMEMAKNKI